MVQDKEIRFYGLKYTKILITNLQLNNHVCYYFYVEISLISLIRGTNIHDSCCKAVYDEDLDSTIMWSVMYCAMQNA